MDFEIDKVAINILLSTAISPRIERIFSLSEDIKT
jgi:hypothetical protein